MQKFPL